MASLLRAGFLLEHSQHGTWRVFNSELPDPDLTLLSVQHKLQWSYQKSMELLEVFT